jgi:hypothetical protein
MLLLMKYSSRTSRTLISLANGTSYTLINPPFVNGRYINQWETPINKWLVLAYGRDQIAILNTKVPITFFFVFY